MSGRQFLRIPGLVVLVAAASGMLLHAQGSSGAGHAVTVTVDTGAPLVTIGSAAVGVNTVVWDGSMTAAAVPDLLTQAGVTALRFPGGSTADSYHWQTSSVTPGKGGYANPADTFDAFTRLAGSVGAQPIITVNYGSNAAGTAGGDPLEAAAWVRYANVTKHLGIKYWEVGNEVYGNGTYGSSWELDLHPRKGPAAYAANYLTYAQAMKAVDPTIQLGAVLVAPGGWPDGQ